METLILTASLGIAAMLADLFRLQKYILPLLIVGLLATIGIHVCVGAEGQSYYYDMFRTDSFFCLFAGLILVLFLFVFILNFRFISHEPKHLSDYASIYFFTLSGAIMLTGYSNLAVLFIGIEILSISLYVLAGSLKSNPSSNEAGLKYFLMGSVASAVLLFGMALLYGATGSFHLEGIADGYAAMKPELYPLFYAGLFMTAFGMLFKVSAFPFHSWSPDVYQGAPSPVTLFMSTIAKIAAAAGFFRLIASAFSASFYSLEVVLQVVIAGSILTGNILALQQTNFKRMMAYSGISHAGYMLMAILCLPNTGVEYIFYYAFSYGMAGVVAFGVGMMVFREKKSEEFTAFRGMFRRSPLMAAAMTVALLSLAGIPPFSGFWAKYFIFSETISQGYVWLPILAVANSMIGVYYYFRILNEMIHSEESIAKPEISSLEAAVIIVAALGLIVVGLVPGLLLSL